MYTTTTPGRWSNCKIPRVKITCLKGESGFNKKRLILKKCDIELMFRPLVALCEVKGIPARIVMHNIAGHITAEAYINGHRWLP